MGVLSKLRARLTYANAMSTIAVFIALGGGAYAVATMSLQSRISGRVFVLATLRDPFITCGDECSAQWGIYIDDKAVPDTALSLSAAAGESDGRPYHTLYGVSAKVPAGKHTIRLTRTDSGGIATVGQISAQLGAIQLSG